MSNRFIINLTQHEATKAQINAGVCDLPVTKQAELRDLLTFERCPTPVEVNARAADLANFASRILPSWHRYPDHWSAKEAMIGGAPFLMGPLERELETLGIKSLYAFSQREVEEQTDKDGTVRKVAIFKHLGFVDGQTIN